jgi:hypothetical protein
MITLFIALLVVVILAREEPCHGKRTTRKLVEAGLSAERIKEYIELDKRLMSGELTVYEAIELSEHMKERFPELDLGHHTGVIKEIARRAV